MANILTPAQVSNRKHSLFCSCGCDAADDVLQDSHEGFREQLAEAHKQLEDQEQRGADSCTGWALRVEDLEAALRQAATTLRQVAEYSHVCNHSRILNPVQQTCREATCSMSHEALADPAVVRLLSKEKEM